MKFVCDRCQTRYSIADEKVRQKILRIRCKTCGNVIVVQGERAAAPGEESPASAHFEEAKTTASGDPTLAPTDGATKKPSSSAPKMVPAGASRAGSTSVPKAAPASTPKSGLASAPKAASTSAPKTAPSSASKAPLSSSPKVAPTAGAQAGAAGLPPPPPPGEDGPDPLGGRVEWYLAVAGVRSGPFSRSELARKVLAVEPGKKVHVWKEGMTGWKPSDEVSVVVRELSILRPAPPPPPPEPPKAPSEPSPKVPSHSAPPKVAAMPASAARSAKAPEKQAPIFPGKPLGPRSATISDAGDFVVDTDPGLFVDVTTKKSKNLHEVESKPLPSSAPVAGESEKTPAPVRPSLPVPAKPATSLPAPSISATLPAAVPLPAGASASSTSLPAATAVASGPSDVDGFSEVILAVAASAPPSSSEPVFPEIVTPPDLATFPASASSDLGKGPARPGMKYLVAAGVIVVLVILIVMVTLRMDTRKVPDIEPVPVAPEPATVEPPKPAAVEPPKPAPAVPQEKTALNVRGGGKRGSGKSSRHVDVVPAPVHQPEQKPLSTPTEPHRPNPFDEAKATVSQSQISAVVRSKINQAGLKTCYERALKMDNRLTSGRIDVTVSIGISGIVQRVVINAPSSFILVEPCIKSAVKRWVFPPSSEEYATNFPLIMQGGM
jgi:predicted Zn finger-like uncharacterized protein